MHQALRTSPCGTRFAVASFGKKEKKKKAFDSSIWNYSVPQKYLAQESLKIAHENKAMGGFRLEAFKFAMCLAMPPFAVFGIANHEELMERVLVTTQYVRYGRGNSEESVAQDELLKRAAKLKELRHLRRTPSASKSGEE